MKKQIFDKKLMLSRQTIVNLDNGTMAAARGGDGLTETCTLGACCGGTAFPCDLPPTGD